MAADMATVLTLRGAVIALLSTAALMLTAEPAEAHGPDPKAGSQEAVPLVTSPGSASSTPSRTPQG